MAEQILQNVYRKDPPVQVNFNYRDIETGTGMVHYYLAISKSRADAFSFILIEDGSVASTRHIGDTGLDKATYTFDTSEFKIPAVIEGVAYGSFSLGAVVQSGSSNNHEIYISAVKLVLVHADASTTDLTNSFTTKGVLEVGTGPASSYVTDLVIFNSITSTTIKVGEKIRLSITLDEDSDEFGQMYCNPASGGSQIAIPFKIDL